MRLFLGEVDRLGMVDRDKLERGGDEAASTEKPDPDGIRHVAIGVEVERPGEAGHRRLRAVDLGQCGAHALPVSPFGLGPVVNLRAAEGFDHHAGGIVCAGCDPIRRAARPSRVRGREGLRGGSGAVEDERGRGIQLLAEEAGMLLLLGLVREALQELLASRASGRHDRHGQATPPDRLDHLGDVVRPRPDHDDPRLGLLRERLDHLADRVAAGVRIDLERERIHLLLLVALRETPDEAAAEAVPRVDQVDHGGLHDSAEILRDRATLHGARGLGAEVVLVRIREVVDERGAGQRRDADELVACARRQGCRAEVMPEHRETGAIGNRLARCRAPASALLASSKTTSSIRRPSTPPVGVDFVDIDLGGDQALGPSRAGGACEGVGEGDADRRRALPAQGGVDCGQDQSRANRRDDDPSPTLRAAHARQSLLSFLAADTKLAQRHGAEMSDESPTGCSCCARTVGWNAVSAQD